MANYILLVFEGEKTERKIFEAIQGHYFSDSVNTILKAVYCTDIYNLYGKLEDDPYLDVFEIIKEKQKNSAELDGIVRENVSEVFLFFDYDGHASAASDDKLIELLQYFDEETENGKLYISYPMVESIKHLKDGVSFHDVVVPAKENIRYKHHVSINCDRHLVDICSIEKHVWGFVFSQHCKKASYIVASEFVLPGGVIEQSEIFSAQLSAYIFPYERVAVLSAFPLFVADYFGYEYLDL